MVLFPWKFRLKKTDSWFPKTFFAGYLFVFVEYFSNRNSKIRKKYCKNYISFLAVVNYGYLIPLNGVINQFWENDVIVKNQGLRGCPKFFNEGPNWTQESCVRPIKCTKTEVKKKSSRPILPQHWDFAVGKKDEDQKIFSCSWPGIIIIMYRSSTIVPR